MVDPALLVEAAVYDPFYAEEAEKVKQAEAADARMRAMQRNGVGGGRNSPTVVIASKMGGLSTGSPTGDFEHAVTAATQLAATAVGANGRAMAKISRGALLWANTKKKMLAAGSQGARKSIRKRGSVMSSATVVAGWLKKDGVARMADINACFGLPCPSHNHTELYPANASCNIT